MGVFEDIQSRKDERKGRRLKQLMEKEMVWRYRASWCCRFTGSTIAAPTTSAKGKFTTPLLTRGRAPGSFLNPFLDLPRYYDNGQYFVEILPRSFLESCYSGFRIAAEGRRSKLTHYHFGSEPIPQALSL